MLVHFSLIDWLIVAAYGAMLVYLGMRKIRGAGRSRDDYILGGRLLTLPSFVAAFVTTWYGGVLGVGEFTYRFGISNWFVFGVPYYVFAILFALLFARKVRSSPAVSIPERLRLDYGGAAGLLGAVYAFFITTPAPYFLMLAVLLQVVTGWPLVVAMIVGAGFSIAYVFVGGFRAVVQTEKLQFALMFLGFIVMAAVLVSSHGFGSFFTPQLPAAHLTITGGNSWQYIIIWFFIALWTLVAPTFHQFTAAAIDARVARNGILLSVVCWFFFDALTTLCGLYARVLLPSLHDPSMAFPLLAELSLPSIAKGIFFVGMLSTVMSTVDGFTFISATIVGNDVIAVLRHRTEEVAIRRSVQVGIIVTSIVSIGFALLVPSIIQLWYVIGTIFIPGLLLPLVGSYWSSWRVSPRATFVAMCLGGFVSLAALTLGYLNRVDGTPQYLFAIEPMYPGLAITIVIYGFHRFASYRKEKRQ